MQVAYCAEYNSQAKNILKTRLAYPVISIIEIPRIHKSSHIIDMY